MKESHKRSIAKSISWRVTASLVTIGLVGIFTRRWEIALSVGGIEIFLKLLIYYLHERVWNRIRWGITYG